MQMNCSYDILPHLTLLYNNSDINPGQAMHYHPLMPLWFTTPALRGTRVLYLHTLMCLFSCTHTANGTKINNMPERFYNCMIERNLSVWPKS